jgi:phosphoribosylaminoimidazole-succinocarboxamide synthase
MYAKEGQDLDAFVEVTLKDDERNDPPITKDALAMLNLLSHEEYDILKKMTQEISKIIKDALSKKDLELYDIKLEFGRVGQDQHIALIDEISGGNMRTYKDGKPVDPMTLEQIMLR